MEVAQKVLDCYHGRLSCGLCAAPWPRRIGSVSQIYRELYTWMNGLDDVPIKRSVIENIERCFCVFCRLKLHECVALTTIIDSLWYMNLLDFPVLTKRPLQNIRCRTWRDVAHKNPPGRIHRILFPKPFALKNEFRNVRIRGGD